MIVWTHTAKEESETSIRGALREYLSSTHAPVMEQVAEEFSVRGGAARLDMAMLTDVLHGYEIKSERDTLVRLADQIRRFSEVCQFLTLVVSGVHRRNLDDVVPDWCGILVAIVVNGEMLLVQDRPARENPDWSATAFATLLWRDEAVALLRSNGIRIPGRTRGSVTDAIAHALDRATISPIVLDAVRRRRARVPDGLQVPCGD